MINIAKQRLLTSKLPIRMIMKIMEDINGMMDEDYNESRMHLKPKTDSVCIIDITIEMDKKKLIMRSKRPQVFIF